MGPNECRILPYLPVAVLSTDTAGREEYPRPSLVDPSCEVRLRSQSPLFSCRASPIDNSFFFYGSLLELLHSFIAKIPVQPQVLLYLCRPGSSGKERSSELTNITEPIILSACAYTSWFYVGQIRLERHRHLVSCYW